MMLLPLQSKAQDVVKLTDPKGNTSMFLLLDHPRLTMGDKTLTIESDSGSKLEFTLPVSAEIVEDVPGDIPNESSVAEIAASEPCFYIGESYIEGSRLAQGTVLRVYDQSGRMAGFAKADEAGNVKLSTADLPTGVYIVECYPKNFKFHKK